MHRRSRQCARSRLFRKGRAGLCASALLSLLASSPSCETVDASRDDDATAAVETGEVEAPAPLPEEALLGPPPPTGEPPPQDAADSAPEEAPLVEETRPSFWRADGRPAWWQGEARTVDGRMRVTVEAIGDDLASARRAAVDAGRAALVRAIGRAPRDERTEAVQMRRLAGEGPGRSRYVVYAMLSAKAD